MSRALERALDARASASMAEGATVIVPPHESAVVSAVADSARAGWTTSGGDRDFSGALIYLNQLNDISVDATNGMATVGAGAYLTHVEAALRRQGWTLDLPFPAALRVADGLTGGPWASALQRRLMSLSWCTPNGEALHGEAASVRVRSDVRIDRALPLPTHAAIPIAACFRARPAHTNSKTRWWLVESVQDAADMAEDAVAHGWPHTQAYVEFGRHVTVGLSPKMLKPIAAMSMAAVRARVGWGTQGASEQVLLGLRIRAELGVAAVLFARLGERMGAKARPIATRQIERVAWRDSVQAALTTWGLRSVERWSERTSNHLAPRSDAVGAELRCTSAILEGHGKWLVQELSVVPRKADDQLHFGKSSVFPMQKPPAPPTSVTVIEPSSLAIAAAQIRAWRRDRIESELRVNVAQQSRVQMLDARRIEAGVSARLAVIEQTLRNSGRTLGLRPSRCGAATLLDLLLGTVLWRSVACAGAAHGRHLDPMGCIRAVQGVDRLGNAGELRRWVRIDGGPGMHAVPLMVELSAPLLLSETQDWALTTSYADAMRCAFLLSARTPHLLRLAVSTTGQQSRVLVRTGGRWPGQRRAVDLVAAVLPGVRQVGPHVWQDAPPPAGTVSPVTPNAARSECDGWTARFARGRAHHLQPLPATDAAGQSEVVLCP
ncbi:MAG: FAD-binding protein [Myxococcales bacterium]|nr:FAD-binding protein [Myxococcales bacterium]